MRLWLSETVSDSSEGVLELSLPLPSSLGLMNRNRAQGTSEKGSCWNRLVCQNPQVWRLWYPSPHPHSTLKINNQALCAGKSRVMMSLTSLGCWKSTLNQSKTRWWIPAYSVAKVLIIQYVSILKWYDLAFSQYRNQQSCQVCF